MLHTTWQRILHSKGRLVLTVLAVATGVTFLTAALVLTGSTRAGFRDSYATVYAGIDAVVRGPDSFGDGPFNGAAVRDTLLEDVRAVPVVAEAEGRMRSVAQLLPDGEEAEGHNAIAVAVPDDPQRAAVEVRAGRLPDDGQEVAIDAAAASSLDLAPGDQVRLLLPAGVQDMQIVGTVGFGPLDGLAGGTRVLVDPRAASELFGDGYHEIGVRAQEGITAEELRQRLAGALGDDAQVLTAAEAAERDAAAAARQTDVYSIIMLAVAGVALLVGGFLIANTFRMLVGQRTRELALLRAVGASRRQVGRSILIEAAITGTLGALLGVALGVGAGALLVTTSGGLLPGMPPMSPTLSPIALVAGPIVGVALALAAGRGAARRAVNVPPVAAMRAGSVADAAPSRLRVVSGWLLAVAGAGVTVAGVQSEMPVLLAAGAVGMIVAFGLLFPLLTGPVLAALSRPLVRMGITGELARNQTLSAPRRTGATAAVLAVTLALISFLLVFGSSLSAASADLLAARQSADFIIRPTTPQGLQDFLLDAASRVDSLPEVATARVVTYDQLRLTDVAAEDGRSEIAAVYVTDPAAVGDLMDVHSNDGEVADVGEGEVAVRATIADGNGWRTGDQLPVEFSDGTTATLTVSALFTGAVTTDWIIAPQSVPADNPGAYREAFVKVADAVDPEQARRSIEVALADFPAARLLSRAEQGAEIAQANESSFGIMAGMLSLSLIVGMLGVVNTLALAMVERVRELGLLRAVGATRGQIRAMVRWEAMLTSILGAVIGSVVGLGLAWIATQALPDGVAPFTVPTLAIVAALGATALLGMLASVLPAARAARIDVLSALRMG